MKTQEKNFDGIKLSGFTAILIMLALTGTAIYLLSLPQTPSTVSYTHLDVYKRQE